MYMRLLSRRGTPKRLAKQLKRAKMRSMPAGNQTKAAVLAAFLYTGVRQVGDTVIKAEILDENAISRAITRISFEIIERNKGTKELCLIGLVSRGAVLAKRIGTRLAETEGYEIPTGLLDIAPFRDDGQREQTADGSRIDFDITGKRVVIIDDVIFTGRTARAAINGLMTHGSPKQIQLAALIDRGHREMPIRADYVGKNLPTSSGENVRVMVKEIDGCDKVVIETVDC